MSQDYFRPSFALIVGAVVQEFRVSQKAIYSFERGNTSRAKAAIVLLAHEYGYTLQATAKAMCRDHTTVHYNLKSARALLHHDTLFKFQLRNCRRLIKDNRVPKPKADPAAYQDKLEACKAEILRLRNLHGNERGWSKKGLARHFGIPESVIAPVIGVDLVER